LHQAIEAKEQVEITPENRSVAQVSRQRFYQQYEMLCGMTGTALGNEGEFAQFYRLAVVQVPQRMPSKMREIQAEFYASVEQKDSAIIRSIEELHQTGRPVLVGTRTIQASRRLSSMLTEQGVRHSLLNGVQDEREADIVANAGQVGMVTIATNMAGRGTDIKISPRAKALGGLHVIGYEFHDSIRIDRQLSGRAARQGQPGSFQFFGSAEDELYLRYAPNLATEMSSTVTSRPTNKRLHRRTRDAQKVADQQGFKQRTLIYREQQWLNKVLTEIAEPLHANKLGERNSPGKTKNHTGAAA
jgi:preprotein translocase subunit SecA